MSEEASAEAPDNTDEQKPEEAAVEQPEAEEPKEPAEAPKEEAPKEEEPKKDEGLLAKAAEPKEAVVPDEYDIKFPEGVKEFDDKSLKDFVDIAKEQSLSQDEAQKAAVAASSLLSKFIEQDNAEQTKWQEDNVKEWEAFDPKGDKAIKAVEALEQSNLKDHFIERGYVHDAKLMALIAEHGIMKSEAKAITGGDAPSVQAGRTYNHESSADLYE